MIYSHKLYQHVEKIYVQVLYITMHECTCIVEYTSKPTQYIQ